MITHYFRDTKREKSKQRRWNKGGSCKFVDDMRVCRASLWSLWSFLFIPFSMQRKHVNRFCEFPLSTVLFGEYDLRARILIVDRNCFTDLAVNPLGESIWTAAWNNTAQTSQYVRQKENRWLGDGFFCNQHKSAAFELISYRLYNQYSDNVAIIRKCSNLRCRIGLR